MPKPALPPQDSLSWVEAATRTVTSTGAGVTRFRVEVKRSAHDRKWQHHSFVHVPPVEAGAVDCADLTMRITAEVDNSDMPIARVCALMEGAKVPTMTRPWETPYSDDGDADDGMPGDAHSAMAMIVAQTLRHNEVLLSRNLAAQDAQLKGLIKQNEMLQAQQEAVLRDRLDLATKARDLIISQAETESVLKRDDTLAEGALTLVQVIAHKLTGGAVANDARLSTLTKILVNIGATITEEQADGLAKVLDAKQMAALAAVTDDPMAKVEQLHEHQAKKEAKKEADAASDDG